MYINRTITNHIKKISKTFPILLVTGPRQVGKTTILKHCSPKRTYITLDDPKILLFAKEDPELFFQRFKPPLTIDEIQYAPELLPYIKIIVDKTKKNGLFWLTGSQQFHLMKNVSESLAGRVGILKMQGLSQEEKLNYSNNTPFLPNKKFTQLKNRRLNLKKLYQIIWRGSFPAIALHNKIDRDVFFGSYLQTYIQRDLRALTEINNERSFLKFLSATAARSGQLVNYADLARDADIAPITAKSWLSALQASGIIYTLSPYHNNITKRLVKAEKLYFLDTGLCAYLAKWDSAAVLEAGAMSGAIFETYVVGELLKSYWHRGKEAPFFFYRDKDLTEIDLLIQKNNKFYPIEIKKTSNPTKDSFKNFKNLDRFNNRCDGAVICLDDEIKILDKNVLSIPVDYI